MPFISVAITSASGQIIRHRILGAGEAWVRVLFAVLEETRREAERQTLVSLEPVILVF